MASSVSDLSALTIPKLLFHSVNLRENFDVPHDFSLRSSAGPTEVANDWYFGQVSLLVKKLNAPSLTLQH